MASIGNGKPDAEGQPPQPERLAASLPPPADVPPPHTEAGRVVLLDVLRRRVEGFPTWMLPRYVVHGVDVYGFHPDNLLRCHPLATSPDGKRACYFLNQIRPLTARDPRRSRVAPGGFWKSERAPVPVEAAPGRIVGTNQSFSFISKEAEDKGGLRGGFLMHELLLPGQAGRLAGGEELALSKIYPSPRVDKKRSQGEGSIGSATRSAAASSAPTSSPRSSNVFSITRSSTAASSAPTSSPRSSDVFSITRSSTAASSPPPSLEAPASSTPPSLEASSLGLQGPASSAPGPASSSPPPIQGAASSQTSPRHRQGAAKRVLLLEVGNSPPREGNNFSCHQVYRALEVLGPGRRVPIDCGDLFLLDCDNAKRQRTAAEF